MCFERFLQAFARWQPGILFDIAAQPILEYRWIDSIHNCPCEHSSKLQLSIRFTPSRCLDVRQDWYPMYYPEGMKARVSPVQSIEPYRILAPTRDSNQEPPGPESRVVTTILPLHTVAVPRTQNPNRWIVGWWKQKEPVLAADSVQLVWCSDHQCWSPFATRLWFGWCSDVPRTQNPNRWIVDWWKQKEPVQAADLVQLVWCSDHQCWSPFATRLWFGWCSDVLYWYRDRDTNKTIKYTKNKIINDENKY